MDPEVIVDAPIRERDLTLEVLAVEEVGVLGSSEIAGVWFQNYWWEHRRKC